jgi:hypothetical protein
MSDRLTEQYCSWGKSKLMANFTLEQANFTLEQAMKDKRGSRSVVVLFLLPRRQVTLGGQRHALTPARK